ncbi:MAG TPA: hypothetical protein PK413_15405 [Thermoanaerobaculia bacterium]|nr:hypothetical protein [Thermoanaerobaculia bacterium]
MLKSFATQRFAFFALLGLGLFASSAATAEPLCRKIHGRLLLAASTEPGCTSPIGLCANATLSGSLRGESDFVGSSFVPTVDTGATGVLILTGDNTLHLRGGDLLTKDAVVLATTGAGEFAEVDTVVGGTGFWEGAHGKYTATGLFANGSGQGSYEGEICWGE